MKVLFSDFIQNMAQDLSMWIQMDKLNYLKMPSVELKNYLVLGSYESLECLDG